MVTFTPSGSTSRSRHSTSYSSRRWLPFSVDEATVFHSRGVARPCAVSIDSTIVSCSSAAKLVQSSATTTSLRAPTMYGVQ